MATFATPVVPLTNADAPKAVFVATLPPPLPTVSPFMVASAVPVIAPVTSIPAPKSKLLENDAAP